MKNYFICEGVRHSQQQQTPITRVCLKKNCNPKLFCDSCVEYHQYHAEKIICFQFLNSILLNQKKILKNCKKSSNTPLLNLEIDKIEAQIQNASKLIVEKKQLSIKEINIIIKLSEQCYHGEIEIIVQYFIYCQNHKKQLQSIVDDQYSLVDEQFLIDLFLQQAQSYTLCKNYEMATQKYEQASQIYTYVQNRTSKPKIDFRKCTYLNQCSIVSKRYEKQYRECIVDINQSSNDLFQFEIQQMDEKQQLSEIPIGFSEEAPSISPEERIHQLLIQISDLFFQKKFEEAFILEAENKEQFEQFEQLKFWTHIIRMYTDYDYLIKATTQNILVEYFLKCIVYVKYKNLRGAIEQIQIVDKLLVQFLPLLSIIKAIILISIGEKSSAQEILEVINHKSRSLLEIQIHRLQEQYILALDDINNLKQSSIFLLLEKLTVLYERGTLKDLLEINYQLQKLTQIKHPRLLLILSLTKFKLHFQQKGDNLNDALELINQLLEIAPGQADLLSIKGKILFLLEDFETSYYIFDYCCQKQNDVKFIFCKGVLLCHQGYYDQAIICYRSAIGIDPFYWPTKFNLGVTLMQLQLFSEAEPFFEETIIYKRRSALLLALCKIMQNKWIEAYSIIKSYFEKKNPQASGIMSFSQLKINNKEQINVIQNSKESKSQPYVQFSLGLLYCKNWNQKSLQDWMESATSIPKEIAQLILENFIELKDLQAALNCYENCLKDDQNCELALERKFQIMQLSENQPITDLATEIQSQFPNDFEAKIFQQFLDHFPLNKNLYKRELKTVSDKIDMLHFLIDELSFIGQQLYIQDNF